MGAMDDGFDYEEELDDGEPPLSPNTQQQILDAVWGKEAGPNNSKRRCSASHFSNSLSFLMNLEKLYKEKLDFQVTEDEYTNYRTKAQAAVAEAIKEGKTNCVFSLSWINDAVAKAGRNPFLSYLVFSPDSTHPVKKRLDKFMDDLALSVFIFQGWHLSYGGCDEGTYVYLKKDDPTKDAAPKPWRQR